MKLEYIHMDIQKSARKLIIVAVAFVLMIAVANYLMGDENRPIQKDVPYNSTVFQEQKFYKGTLDKCDETCVNTPILRKKTIKQIVFNDVVKISKEEEKLDIINRFHYELCYINNTCEQYTNILDIHKIEYTKNIPIGIETKYRKEPNGSETKKRWEWLL